MPKPSPSGFAPFLGIHSSRASLCAWFRRNLATRFVAQFGRGQFSPRKNPGGLARQCCPPGWFTGVRSQTQQRRHDAATTEKILPAAGAGFNALDLKLGGRFIRAIGNGSAVGWVSQLNGCTPTEPPGRRNLAMKTKLSVVEDGRERLMRALRPTEQERRRCYEEVLRQLEQKHAAELRRAGILRRLLLRRKLHEEASAAMRREFKIPSGRALFFARRA